MKHPVSLGLVFLLVGCNLFTPVDEDSWPEVYAKRYCSSLKKCFRGYYESEYSDMKDCVDEVEDDTEDIMDDYDDRESCDDFDEDNARDCLSDFSSFECEDFWEDENENEDNTESCWLSEIYDCD